MVEIPISAYDVLRALHQAREHGRRVGVVGFPNVVLGARGPGPMLDLTIQEVPLAGEFKSSLAVQRRAEAGWKWW